MDPSPRSRMERRGIHRVSGVEVRLRGVVRKNWNRVPGVSTAFGEEIPLRVSASVVECGVSHCFPVILWFTAAQLGVWCACGRPSWDPSVGLLVCACVIEAYRRFGEKRTLYYSTCTCRYLSMQNTSVCYICCFHNALSFVSVFENLCFLFIFPVSSPLL